MALSLGTEDFQLRSYVQGELVQIIYSFRLVKDRPGNNKRSSHPSSERRGTQTPHVCKWMLERLQKLLPCMGPPSPEGRRLVQEHLEELVAELRPHHQCGDDIDGPTLRMPRYFERSIYVQRGPGRGRGPL